MSAPKTILIIDDETDLVETLQDLLTEVGYHVITAKNGIEGLHKLNQIIPHLIILDMNMPEMGGIAFYKEILNAKTGRASYPVLVFTARANLEELFKNFEIDGFVTKPFCVEELFKKIAEIMEKYYGKDDENSNKETLKKALIIEDDDEMFSRLFAKFTKHHYAVTRANSGAQAVQQAVTQLPNVILLKFKLPDDTGDVVALKLKMMSNLVDIPIIIYIDPAEKKDFSAATRIYEKLGVKLFKNTNEASDFLVQAELLIAPRINKAA